MENSFFQVENDCDWWKLNCRKANVLKISQGSPEQSGLPGGSGEVNEGVAMNNSTRDHN